jgi:hypothetical protein
MAGLANTCTMWEQMKSKGTYRGMSPFYITQVLPNSSAGYISIRHKLQGPNVKYLIRICMNLVNQSFSFVIVPLVLLVFNRLVMVLI